MTIRINLWTMFWLFVWPVLPFIGFFVSESNFRKGHWTRTRNDTVCGWSFCLTIGYLILLGTSLLPSELGTVITYADTVEQRVTVEEGVTALVTVEYKTFLQLPWSYCEQKKYVRFESVGDAEQVWWIDTEDSTKIDESEAEQLNDEWESYWAAVHKKEDAEEAKRILQQRYQQQDQGAHEVDQKEKTN